MARPDADRIAKAAHVGRLSGSPWCDSIGSVVSDGPVLPSRDASSGPARYAVKPPTSMIRARHSCGARVTHWVLSLLVGLVVLTEVGCTAASLGNVPLAHVRPWPSGQAAIGDSRAFLACWR